MDDSTIDHSEAALQEWKELTPKPDPGVLPSVQLDERSKAAALARRKKRQEGQNTT